MKSTNLKTAFCVLSAAALVAGCSGGSGDDAAPPPTANTGVPASAQENAGGLVAYVRQLIGANSETSEPVLIGDAVLPVDDRSEPAPLN